MKKSQCVLWAGKYSIASVADKRMIMQHWWNETDREELKCLDKKPDPVPLCPS